MAYRLTITDLTQEIKKLGTDRVLKYVSGRSCLRIVKITEPEGPIQIRTWDVNESEDSARVGSISTSQLARIALVCANKPNYPLHIDRLFSAGGNTRSALETVLAHTPHFFMCYPKRVDAYTGETLQNLKHIMWLPGESHPIGQISTKEYSQVITEVELGIDFGFIGITEQTKGDDFESIEAKTMHTQMQLALIEIGNALNFRTWIASNDRHIPVRDTTMGSLFGVIRTLDEISILYKTSIRDAAQLIDCIWFTHDGDHIPAIIEIEHSTGVTSGLTRMRKLRDAFPAIATTFTIVAPNHLRNKVITEANQKVFQPLKARYMPYSTVRELYGLIKRYQLSNVVTHTFVDPFMERVVEERS